MPEENLDGSRSLLMAKRPLETPIEPSGSSAGTPRCHLHADEKGSETQVV
jgi:hypothetical protein